jgi:hypothetical protein
MLRSRNEDAATGVSSCHRPQPTSTPLRKSLAEDSGSVPKACEVVARGSGGAFVPSDEQRRLRARLWTELRNDPLVVPATIGPSRIATITGENRVHAWWADKAFRSWICNRDAALERAELLVDLWLDGMVARLAQMSDKDYVQAGKLLMEVARKMPDRSRPDVAPVQFANKSPEELREFLQTAAAACGLQLVAAPTAQDETPTEETT